MSDEPVHITTNVHQTKPELKKTGFFWESEPVLVFGTPSQSGVENGRIRPTNANLCAPDVSLGCCAPGMVKRLEERSRRPFQSHWEMTSMQCSKKTMSSEPTRTMPLFKSSDLTCPSTVIAAPTPSCWAWCRSRSAPSAPKCRREGGRLRTALSPFKVFGGPGPPGHPLAHGKWLKRPLSVSWDVCRRRRPPSRPRQRQQHPLRSGPHAFCRSWIFARARA